MRSKFLAILALSLFIRSAQADGLSVTKVEASRDRGFDYLDIYTTGNLQPKGLLLENQLVLEFPDAKYSGAKLILVGKSTRIKAVQIKPDKKVLRVMVELKTGIDYEIVNVFGKNKSVIEISDRTGNTEQTVIAWEKENLKSTREAIRAQKIKPEKGKDQALKGKIIVIDPGHGGIDPGAISKSGIKEKVLTLQASRRLADQLKAAGATVYLTRNSDRATNLRDVVGFANSVRANLLLSMHYNTGERANYAGTETYYFTRKSQKLALLVHASLVRGIQRRDRGLRRAAFFALKQATMPSILVEPVYITNPDEERLAISSAFQKELAVDITKGVKAYFRNSKG